MASKKLHNPPYASPNRTSRSDPTPGPSKIFLALSSHNREIKIHVYGTRQTANVSWEFLKIENKQIKTVQNDSFG